MTKARYSKHTQTILDQLLMHHPQAVIPEVASPGRNETMPSMFERFCAYMDEARFGYMNEEDPESPVEAYFRLREGLTVEDGLAIGMFLSVVNHFDMDIMGDEDGDGRSWFRLLFDSPDELDEGARVKTYEGRVGTVNAVEREDEDEPRSLRSNVTFDDNGLGEWVPFIDLEKVDEA